MSRTVIDLIALIGLPPLIILGLYLLITSGAREWSGAADWFDDAQRTTIGFFLVSAAGCFWFIAFWELIKNL